MENYHCVAFHELLNPVRVSEKVLDQGPFSAQVDGAGDVSPFIFVLVPAVYNQVILSALIQNLR